MAKCKQCSNEVKKPDTLCKQCIEEEKNPRNFGGRKKLTNELKRVVPVQFYLSRERILELGESDDFKIAMKNLKAKCYEIFGEKN